MFWTIAVLVGLALVICGFLTGHWFFGIINGIVAFWMLGQGLKNKKKPFIIPGIIGPAVMIGVSIFGIQMKHPFIAGIIGLVVNFGLFSYMAAKEDADDKAAKEEVEKQAVEKRKALETRAATGDEAAKQELIEMGTDYTSYYSYRNFDFDKDALQRVYNLTVAAMSAVEFPLFNMEEMKNQTIGDRYNPSYYYIWEGKTTRGDTVYMQYRVGRTTSGSITYKLHLKALPEVVQAIGNVVDAEMNKFLSTVPEWNMQMDKVANSYQGGSDNISNIHGSGTRKVFIYSGYSGGNCVYRIEGDKIYSGYSGGNCVYRIEGDKIYSGYSGGDCVCRIEGDKIYSGYSGGDCVCRIEGDKIYSGYSGGNCIYRLEEG